MKLQSFFPSLCFTSIVAVCISQPAWAQVTPATQVTDLRLEATDRGLALIIKTADGSSPQFFQTRLGNTLFVDLFNAQLRLPKGAKDFQINNPVTGIASIRVKQQYATSIMVTIVGTSEEPIANITTGSQGLVVSLGEPQSIAQTPPTPATPTPSTPGTPGTPPTTIPLPETPGTPPTTIPIPETPQSPPEELPPVEVEELPGITATVELEPEAEPAPVPPPVIAQESYTPPKNSSVSRDDTSILDTPQAIDVVPEQVIEDQADLTVGEALENVPGVTSGRASTEGLALTPVIRGFESNNILRNGLRDDTQRFFGGITTNIERIEVLKGPASILFGAGNLGGTVNLVTKQPLSEPFYSLEFNIGQFNLYRPVVDLSGPLNSDRTVLYRLVSSYETSDTFQDFEEIERRFIVAPSITWLISDRTKVTFEAEYIDEKTRASAPELPSIGTVVRNPNSDFEGKLDISTNLGEPSIVESEGNVTRFGYRLEHQFSENWSIKHEFLAAFGRIPENTGNKFILPVSLDSDLRTLNRFLGDNPSEQDNYTFNTNVVGNFNTGSIAHKLLFGVEYAHETSTDQIIFSDIDPIDIYNPIYSPNSVRNTRTFQDFETELNTTGIYLQDQVQLLDNFILVLGGRFDITNQYFEEKAPSRELTLERNDNVLSPRVGLIYKPLENISLYASFSRSFEPVIGQGFEGEVFEPELGTQYEVGVKAELLDDRLFATLAYYNLTRTNFVEQDPDNPGFQIQIGEQQSQGIEFDIVGEILPGWNIIATYTYTDAVITEDERIDFVDNQLPNTPENAASLWTTYTLQEGTLQGLGFGIGLFFQGERQGDLGNTFVLPSYVRTDAAIYYRRDQLKLAVNFRNLFNIEYFEGARNNVRVIPGAPFTVIGTASWEF